MTRGLLKPQPRLPDHAAQTLRNLYEQARRRRHTVDDVEILDGYIAKLRKAGWLLDTIAIEASVTREMIRHREENATEGGYIRAPDAPAAPRKPLKPRKIRKPQMRPEFVRWLQETHALATQCRGVHDLDHPYRIASEKLWAAIDGAIKQGISIAAIADALGVKKITIRAGLARHGHRKNPPSQRAYLRKVLDPGARRHPPRQMFCKQGHALAGDNISINRTNGYRSCRQCRNKRARRYYQQKKKANSA